MLSMKKYIYVTVGLISFVLGIIGVILPILPTTPFLLVSSVCFAKGSNRFNNWFISTNLYKKHLQNFVKEKAMTLKEKIYILGFANTIIAIPLIIVDNLLVKFILVLVIICKAYYFIFRIKTIK